jgi:uncharacterized membrane protein YphA (DoxX/SURF4 family)
MTIYAAHGLSLLRMSFGLYFLADAIKKTAGGWLNSGDGVASFIGANLEGAAAPYQGFLGAVALPNADRFAQLVVLGEWVVGASLLLGLLTRLGALVGMWLMVNFMLAKGLPNPEGSQDRLFFVACAVFALTAAGLVWGLDGALRQTLDAHPITRWLAGIPRLPRIVAPAHRAPALPERVRRSA